MVLKKVLTKITELLNIEILDSNNEYFFHVKNQNLFFSIYYKH